MESKSNDLVEKFKNLGIGEKIIVVAGLVLFIDSFLPWYSVDLGPIGSFTQNGWENPGGVWSLLAVLISLAMVAAIVVRTFSPATLPDNVSGVTWPKIHLGGGIAVAVLVLIKLLNESSSLGFGFYIGIVCAAALAVGGVLMYREEMAAGGG